MDRPARRAAAVGELTRGIVLQVPYVAGALGFAFWWFGRKDVLS